MLYGRSSRLVKLFNKCSKPVLLELCRSFCTVFCCPYFWTHYKKNTFSKIRVAYNNVYRKTLIGVSKRASASGIFISNNIPNFKAVLRKSIYSFTTRLSSSSNKLISSIEQFLDYDKFIWKTWAEKSTFKSTMMSFYVFLVFILPDFICSFSILFSPKGY